MANIDNFEYQVNQTELPKEVTGILKMLDTEEWKNEFLLNLQASKEHLTKTFWKPLFEKQFENWAELIDSLYDFCKSIDINEFTRQSIDDQYQQFSKKLKWQLWEVDLYREIELINAYINYDLKVEDTIRVDKILASASEKQMTNKEALENVRMTRFAYADILINNETWELAFIDTFEEKKKDLLVLVEVSSNRLRLKEWLSSELTFNQKILQEFLKSDTDITYNADFKVEDWKIIIGDSNLPEDIKQMFSWELVYNNNSYTIWERYAEFNTNYIDVSQLDALVFTEQESLLNKIMYIFSKYNREENMANYKSDYDEVIKGNYIPLKQIKDNSNWFSAILLEDIKTTDITIALRWTNDFTDIFYSDLQILLNSKWLWNYLPSQIESLKDLLKDIEKEYKWRKIQIKWHSLWWYLSELSEWLNTKLDIVDTVSVNWPGSWEAKVDLPNKVWQNCVKFSTNETISNTWTKSNKFLVVTPWTEHSVNSVIENMSKNLDEKESYVPIIDTSKLKDIF